MISLLLSNIFKGEAWMRLYLEPHNIIGDDWVWGGGGCMFGGGWKLVLWVPSGIKYMGCEFSFEVASVLPVW